MLMSLIKYLNIIWGSGSSMKAISLNPRTDKGGGGDGCNPCNKVFGKILKRRFTLRGWNFQQLFIHPSWTRNFDMSIVCPSFVTFPWQPLVSCRFGQLSTFFTWFYIFQFSSSNSSNSPIYTFQKHSGLILYQFSDSWLLILRKK